MKKPQDNHAGIRADKWLWAARFFKTRSLAMQAINGGKVHLDGQRLKPARKLNVGDQLTITRGCYTFSITIEGLSLQRGPAEVARSLYSETPESQQARKALQEARKLQGESSIKPSRRPDKRARRQIHQFKTDRLDQ
jgi:ribosome-associated heat shock protein Hsp15